MNFKHCSFSVFTAVLCILFVVDANAKTCDTGQYLLTKSCYDCQPGCYCGNPSAKLDPKDKINREQIPQWCAGQRSECSHKYRDGYGICGRPDAKVAKCPTDFPKSDAKATSAEDCYTLVGDKKLYNKPVNCDAGQYLPKDSANCAPCSQAGKDYYCPGKTSPKPSTTQSQGALRCPSGQQQNSAGTGCESIYVDCYAGQYLPKNSKTCAPCPDDGKSVCHGISNAKQSANDQGIATCTGNTKPNISLTECVSAITQQKFTTCDAGYYLPKGATECQLCKFGNYYCPSGFQATVPATKDWGLVSCDGTPSTDRKRCESKTSEHVLIEKNDTSYSAPVDLNFSVAPGYYLPANASNQKTCKNGYYCPGGNYERSNVDQGLFKCPLDSETNQSKTACTLERSKDQMRYGKNGTKETALNRQCWLKTNTSEYKSCVFGK